MRNLNPMRNLNLIGNPNLMRNPNLNAKPYYPIYAKPKSEAIAGEMVD